MVVVDGDPDKTIFGDIRQKSRTVFKDGVRLRCEGSARLGEGCVGIQYSWPEFARSHFSATLAPRRPRRGVKRVLSTSGEKFSAAPASPRCAARSPGGFVGRRSSENQAKQMLFRFSGAAWVGVPPEA